MDRRVEHAPVEASARCRHALFGVFRPLAWLDVIAPWVRETARSLTLGCVIAASGCGPSNPRVEVEGVVRDGRTGQPIPGARITTDDGRSVQTDASGHFAVTVDEGDERLLARAEDHEGAEQTVRVRRAGTPRVSLVLPPIERSVEVVVRARCEDLEVRWARIESDDCVIDAECAGCHEAPHERARFMVDGGADSLACAACHASGAHDGTTIAAIEPIVEAWRAEDHACADCHDLEASTPHLVRAFDQTAELDHLGTGATCASCHRAPAGIDAAPRMPQTELVFGRGARSTVLDRGVHRDLSDACVRCHMGSHSAHDLVALAPADPSCEACHGEVEPRSIGLRDWDGDGRAGPLALEHDRALARVERRLHGRIAALALRDRCGRVASSFRAHRDRLHLVDAADRLLGDCDGDGSLDGEAGTTISALPAPLASAAYDLAMLRSDGSSGIHNPAYAFAIVATIERALR